VPPPPPPPPLLEEPPEAHDEATSHAPVTIIPSKRRTDFRATCRCPESRKECRWRKTRAAITKFTYRPRPILGNIAADRIIRQGRKWPRKTRRLQQETDQSGSVRARTSTGSRWVRGRGESHKPRPRSPRILFAAVSRPPPAFPGAKRHQRIVMRYIRHGLPCIYIVPRYTLETAANPCLAPCVLPIGARRLRLPDCCVFSR